METAAEMHEPIDANITNRGNGRPGLYAATPEVNSITPEHQIGLDLQELPDLKRSWHPSKMNPRDKR